MAEYDESEYFSDTQEEIAEREAQEALRRMVRTEIRRVQTGAANADIGKAPSIITTARSIDTIFVLFLLTIMLFSFHNLI